MTDPARTPTQDAASLRDKRRAAWAGVGVNAPAALVKIAAGTWSDSQALIADGVHSLSDLISDAAVIWALGHSHRPPDAEHPFGHGRFETLATLAVAVMLGLAAFGILIDAAWRVLDPPDAAPGALALWIAAASILLKEVLFRYTRHVARRTDSAMMMANAWHHRSDALSSVVALAGIGAAMAGFVIADALAAGVIALMLGRIAWGFARPALAELVDAAPADDLAARIEAEIRAIPGVRDVHDLRLRQTAGRVRGDAHVTFDGDLTLSEAHRLTEAARARVRDLVPQLTDILLHPEPEGHADGYGAHRAPLRPEVEDAVRAELARHLPAARLIELRLDYRDDGLRGEVLLAGPTAAPGAAGVVESALRLRFGASTRIAVVHRPG